MPLPEVIIIHHDSSYLDEVKKLEGFILEELNVKRMTVSTKDDKYGVTLCAEPNNERLGKRLKDDFKKTGPAVKALTSEQLIQFQQRSEIIVEGHVLTADDIKVFYRHLTRP